jgi:hypothetical protein
LGKALSGKTFHEVSHKSYSFRPPKLDLRNSAKLPQVRYYISNQLTVGAAPAGAAAGAPAGKKAEKEAEPEEEAQVDMGGLFGDEDY